MYRRLFEHKSKVTFKMSERSGDRCLGRVLHAILAAERQSSLRERLAREQLQRQAEQQKATRVAQAMAQLKGAQYQYNLELLQSQTMDPFVASLPAQSETIHSL